MIDMNARKLKGEQIAKTVQIKKEGLDKWLVPSQSGNTLWEKRLVLARTYKKQA